MISRATGLRVEVLGGSLVLSRTDCATRAEVVRRLAATLPAECGVPVAMPMDPDDFAVPDLVVRREGGGPEIALVVEVVARQEKAREMVQKNDWYAVACVSALLVVDPRHGTWMLGTRPRDGRYGETRAGRYGQDIPLPAPLSRSLSTSGLPRYGA
ncbi:Uma2 family endonuclease [Streptomyces sp. ISL-10]|nr:Uma2 family endonuclease [Streptomyces sp. ISL-10]